MKVAVENAGGAAAGKTLWRRSERKERKEGRTRKQFCLKKRDILRRATTNSEVVEEKIAKASRTGSDSKKACSNHPFCLSLVILVLLKAML